MTKILNMLGRKASGKDTVANFLVRNHAEFRYDGIGTALSIGGCKIFHWADRLKELMHELLDVPREHLWGTDEDKNSPTTIRWGNLPHYQSIMDSSPALGVFLTARELLQQFGTNIGRSLKDSIWIDWLLKHIKNEHQKVDLAVIADGRFPNECRAVSRAGGRTIALTRGKTNDNHASEMGYYECIKLGLADTIIDNSKLTIEETNREVVKVLKEWGWI